VEAAGVGLDLRHAATMAKGSPGVLHGMFSYVLQNEDGQIQEAHSVSAGLDYPGVGPEHSYFKDIGRARYESATDAEALAAFEELSLLEGIIPAFESSHALAWVLRNAGTFKPGTLIALCLSGRGDKDLDEYMLRTGKQG
jgi:tryptophan synthase beta chain